jgi:hypothetical protein
VLAHWRLRPAIQRGLAAVAVFVLLVIPAATAKRLRFDLDHPHDGYIMAVARDMRPMLPPGARVELFDLRGNGSDLVLMRYKMLFGAAPSRRPGLVTLHSGSGFADVLRNLGPGVYYWIEDGGPEASSLFGIGLASGASYLVVRGGQDYRLINAWPVTPATDVFRPEDLE